MYERRRIDGEEIWCVLIDSVQSQANRMETALLALADSEDTSEEKVLIPYVTVDFVGTGLEPLERITSLEAPHRVYDAILRDSLLGDKPFMQSDEGKRLASAKPADASALLEISPAALVFGAWHSQGSGGGLGAKFPRTLVSEIMGIVVPVEENRNQQTREIDPKTFGRRTGSRIDPLGILAKVKVYKSNSGWDTSKTSAGRGAKEVRPSQINHSNIAPTVAPLGVTCDHAEHRFTITLAGIRRLRFGGGKRDAAGQALIASLGLLAMVEQDACGYALRSRCDLVCEGNAPLELVGWDGSTKTIQQFDRAAAQQLYRTAYEDAKLAGFEFRPLNLKPAPKLVEIIRQSRDLALEGQGGDEEDNQ